MEFKPGDRVMFAAKFLRSAGIFMGDECFQEGTVAELRQLHVPAAVVQWDHGGTSTSLLCNLVHKNRRHLEPN